MFYRDIRAMLYYTHNDINRFFKLCWLKCCLYLGAFFALQFILFLCTSDWDHIMSFSGIWSKYGLCTILMLYTNIKILCKQIKKSLKEFPLTSKRKSLISPISFCPWPLLALSLVHLIVFICSKSINKLLSIVCWLKL